MSRYHAGLSTCTSPGTDRDSRDCGPRTPVRDSSCTGDQADRGLCAASWGQRCTGLQLVGAAGVAHYRDRVSHRR